MRTRLLAVALAAATGLVVSAAASGSSSIVGSLDGSDHAARHGVHQGGAAAVRTAAGRAVIYGGLTSQVWPVFIETSANGRRIKRAVVALEPKCSPSGEEFSFPDRYANVPVNRRGRFSVRQTDGGIEDGYRYEDTYRFSGRVEPRRRRVTGVSHYSGRITEVATGAVETCDSGPVRFSARR